MTCRITRRVTCRACVPQDKLKVLKKKPAELLAEWDDNGDGIIQREEFLQAAEM